MKDRIVTGFLVIVFLIGVSVLLYPAVSNYINEQNQTKAIIEYDNILKDVSEEDFQAYFDEASRYNADLAKDYMAFYEPERVSGYTERLDVTGTGLMAYVMIPSIQVTLPIYHGTAKSVLDHAIGHMEGTSLPVGGMSTHSVLVGHRGLPSAKLFSNLNKLEKGDEFSIAVLDRILRYEVDQILTVEPNDVSALKIVPGMDYCTLLTCTPYGVNTHRLLIRGKRIEEEGATDAPHVYVASNAIPVSELVMAVIVAVPLLFVLLIVVIIGYRGNTTVGGNHEKKQKNVSE